MQLKLKSLDSNRIFGEPKLESDLCYTDSRNKSDLQGRYAAFWRSLGLRFQFGHSKTGFSRMNSLGSRFRARLAFIRRPKKYSNSNSVQEQQLKSTLAKPSKSIARMWKKRLPLGQNRNWIRFALNFNFHLQTPHKTETNNTEILFSWSILLSINKITIHRRFCCGKLIFFN